MRGLCAQAPVEPWVGMISSLCRAQQVPRPRVRTRSPAPFVALGRQLVVGPRGRRTRADCHGAKSRGFNGFWEVAVGNAVRGGPIHPDRPMIGANSVRHVLRAGEHSRHVLPGRIESARIGVDECAAGGRVGRREGLGCLPRLDQRSTRGSEGCEHGLGHFPPSINTRLLRPRRRRHDQWPPCALIYSVAGCALA